MGSIEKRAWREGEITKCRRKRSYVTADEAKVRATEMKARAYRCRWCDLWHLTSCLDGYENAEPRRCPDCDSAQCSKGKGGKTCTGNRVREISGNQVRKKFTDFLFG